MSHNSPLLPWVMKTVRREAPLFSPKKGDLKASTPGTLQRGKPGDVSLLSDGYTVTFSFYQPEANLRDRLPPACSKTAKELAVNLQWGAVETLPPPIPSPQNHTNPSLPFLPKRMESSSLGVTCSLHSTPLWTTSGESHGI